MADIGQIAQVNAERIARIRSGQRVRLAQLAEEQRQFNVLQRNRNQILDMFRTAFGDAGGEGGVAVPNAFARNVELFLPGAGFGENNLAIERGGQQAIAAGQLGLAQTGVSSGTNVAGLRARVLADTALANQQIEARRAAGLSGALTQFGSAQLEGTKIATDLQRTLLSSLGNLR
jgi:hypothetical protein